MPTDTGRRTVEVRAPLRTVLATVRDVESQPLWVKEVRQARVLRTGADGKPATASFVSSTPVGSDSYTLAYEHSRDGMSWTLVQGRLQSAQEGRYRLRRLAKDLTEVDFELTITHGLPLPGFVRRRVISALVDSTVDGLKAYVESGVSAAPAGR